jgi:catechol 2,3-dioxygenase-like lactoylglutathione lyase family enzyme
MKARLGVIELVVKDIAQSLAFYRQLGLDVPASADTEPHVEYPLADGLRLAWDTVDTIKSYNPVWTAPSGGHRVAFAFEFDTVGEVDDAYNELVGAGYTGEKEPWDAFWGLRYAIVLDPDGNAVDLCAPL